MSTKQDILDRIIAAKLIAILRLRHQSVVQRTIDAVVAGGIRVLEITTNTPGFAEEIENARRRHPGVLIGAGTVLNVALAKQALAGGAQFMVTPNTNKKVAKLCKDEGVPILMGAMTPTEVADAVAFGAYIIKLFPAGDLGISYLKSLKGPFDSIPFFAVGGIGLATMEDWFEAGITGVGLGSSLVKNNVKTDADFEMITENAKKFKRILSRIEMKDSQKP